MRLIVNGEVQEYNGEANLVCLLQQLGANGDRVATMLNEKVIRKQDRPSAGLNDEDRVEVLVLASGGS